MPLINVDLTEEILDMLAENQEYIAKEEMLKKCDRPQALTKMIRYYNEKFVRKNKIDNDASNETIQELKNKETLLRRKVLVRGADYGLDDAEYKRLLKEYSKISDQLQKINRDTELQSLEATNEK